ncbi:MAG: sulfatase-like hydrolase/transferase [Thermoanaerobaculia bacterium]
MRETFPGPRLPLASVFVALLAALAAAGCGKGRPESKSWPGAPVVLVTIDTLRSDHLPMYGSSGVETPVLSAFRKEAILFEKAYSHVPLTLPSHGTIFTGNLPVVNGLRDNLGYRLSEKLPTLAELLKKSGYATGGAVSTIVLNGSSGIGRGFDYWEDSIEPSKPDEALGRVQRSGAETEQLLASWLEAQPPATPTFTFLHLYEPHTPYEPPEPYATRYKGREYDGEIAWSDELVGRYFDLLRRKGIYDRALIIVLSDHGEGLGEHGEDEHGIFLYRWALQVPLMVKLPKSYGAGASVPTPVQLSDVFATVVKALGIPDVPPPPGTVSLLDVAAGRGGEGRKLYAESVFPRIHFGWSDLASLIDGPWQYVEAPRPELYDLGKDPAEKENLASGKPPAFRTLRIEMERRHAGFTAPGPIDPEEAKKLASLGYLSSGASAGSGPLPDPKDEILLIGDLKTATGLFQSAHYPEAIAIFRKLIARNPRMLDVWDLYSESLRKIGRDEEALDALKKGIAASPEGATHYFVAVANLCLRLGKVEEAARNAEIAKGRGDPAADDVLARIHLMRKEWDAAEAAAKVSLKARPNKSLPYLILARVEIERNHLENALKLVEKARALAESRSKTTLQDLHFLQGDILGRMERLPEAEVEFKEEIRLFPEGLDSYGSLAVLYAAQGRLADVRETIRKLVTANPTPAAYALAVKTLTVVGDRSGAESFRRTAAAKFPSDRRFGGIG